MKRVSTSNIVSEGSNEDLNMSINQDLDCVISLPKKKIERKSFKTSLNVTERESSTKKAKRSLKKRFA
jgi:hypothetical protein